MISKSKRNLFINRIEAIINLVLTEKMLNNKE